MSSAFTTAQGSTVGTWWWVPLVAVLVSLIIFWINRRDNTKARREEESKIARRESWRLAHDEIQKLLSRAWNVCFRVREQSPLTAGQLVEHDVPTLRRDAEELANRHIPSILSDSLNEFASVIDKVAGGVVPDAVVSDPAEFRQTLHKAAVQGRYSRELEDLITRIRQELREEWGS